MDSNTLFNIFNSKRVQPKSRRSISVMIVCFSISVFLWALIMLSRNYSAHVRFHLEYENLPSGKVITNPLPKRIEFLINASGFDLLAYRFKSTSNQIFINVSDNLEDRNRIANNVYKVSTKNLLADFSEQLKRDVNIQSIMPDSIEFNFSALLIKRLPVKSKVKINFEKQFDATGVYRLSPDSVAVSGPLSYLDTLQFVETIDTTFNNVRSKVNQPVRLKLDHDLNAETKKVNFTLPVEKFTEGSLEIPLETVNTAGKQKLKLFPEKVTAHYLVGLSNYEKVTEAQFSATVDASEIIHDSNKLNVKLNKNPDFVKIMSIEPTKVEYIILK